MNEEWGSSICTGVRNVRMLGVYSKLMTHPLPRRGLFLSHHLQRPTPRFQIHRMHLLGPFQDEYGFSTRVYHKALWNLEEIYRSQSFSWNSRINNYIGGEESGTNA